MTTLQSLRVVTVAGFIAYLYNRIYGRSKNEVRSITLGILHFPSHPSLSSLLSPLYSFHRLPQQKEE